MNRKREKLEQTTTRPRGASVPLWARAVQAGFSMTEMVITISVIGVLIFSGLTAYDTPNIKNTYVQHAQAGDQDWLAKSAIDGALNLYMNFINLFMFLLQFLGDRK
jgi:prepilin-type N-terminal cleavage/methylation domain-containing protein